MPLEGLKISSSEDPEFVALEEKLVLVESEKDNLILEVGLPDDAAFVQVTHSLQLCTGQNRTRYIESG